MQDYKTLKVWQLSHQLVLDVYRVTGGFPRDEVYGLTAQMRRSSSSIPTNIAEGTGRGTSADFGRFLQHAIGSASELEYQFLLSRDLGYLPEPDWQALTERVVGVRRMLIRLLDRVRSGTNGAGALAEDRDNP